MRADQSRFSFLGPDVPMAPRLYQPWLTVSENRKGVLDVDTVKRVVQQLRDGGYLRILDERVIVPDLEALRRLYQLLGMKEEVRSA